jgi:hypothetical protein
MNPGHAEKNSHETPRPTTEEFAQKLTWLNAHQPVIQVETAPKNEAEYHD